VKSKS